MNISQSYVDISQNYVDISPNYVDIFPLLTLSVRLRFSDEDAKHGEEEVFPKRHLPFPTPDNQEGMPQWWFDGHSKPPSNDVTWPPE